MTGTVTLMFQSCISYKKKNKATQQPTGETGYILKMLQVGTVDGEIELTDVTFFLDKFDRPELKAFDLVDCVMEYELNRSPKLIEVGSQVVTDNKLTIMLP